MSRQQQNVIRTSNGRDVEVTGSVIAVAGRSQVALEGGDLWFHLQVWQTDKGFVPVLRAFVSSDTEPMFVDAESVNAVSDVENFFYVFEPGEIIPLLLSLIHI